MAAILDGMNQTAANNDWREFERLEQEELLEDLNAFIQTLPYKQRIVMQVFVDGYPETSKMQELRHRVSATTGEEETLASVKRPLQEVRKKLRERMGRRVKP